jgi:hypothetical protein
MPIGPGRFDGNPPQMRIAFLRGLLEVHLPDPREVSLRPGGRRRRRTPAVPQQTLPEAVPRAQLILLCRPPGTHQVAQRLVRGVWDPHRRQITGPVAPRQLGRIAPVRLDAIAGLHRDQGRRHHVAVHPETRQLPINRSRSAPPRNTRAGAPPAPASSRPAESTPPVGDHAQRPDVSVWLRDRDRLRVDIQPDKSYLLHDRLLSPVALHSRVSTSQVTHALRIGAGRSIVTNIALHPTPPMRT